MSKLTEEQIAFAVSATRTARKAGLQNAALRQILNSARSKQRDAMQQLKSSLPSALVQEFEQATTEGGVAFRKLISEGARPKPDYARRMLPESRAAAVAEIRQKNQSLVNSGQYVASIPLGTATDIFWSSGIDVWSHTTGPGENYVDFVGDWGSSNEYVGFGFIWKDPGPGMAVADIEAYLECDGTFWAFAAGGFWAFHDAELEAIAKLTAWNGPGFSVPPGQPEQSQEVAYIQAQTAGIFVDNTVVTNDAVDRFFRVGQQGLTILPDTYGQYWVIVVLNLDAYNSFQSMDDGATGATGYGDRMFEDPFRLYCPYVAINVTYAEGPLSS